MSNNYNPTLNPQKMSLLMHNKRLSQLRKGRAFDCFTLEIDQLENFLITLKQNLSRLVNPTRFQIAIYDKHPPVPHFMLVDCYIKDGIVHTLTLDPAVYQPTLQSVLQKLLQQFPDAKHITFYANKDEGTARIQASDKGCGMFARESAGLLSKIPADELYFSLERMERDVCFVDDEEIKTIPVFTSADITSGDLKILAPLFRSMQSITTLENFSKDVLSSEVSSKSEKKSLGKWVSNTKEYDEKRKQFINTSITLKGRKYIDEVNKSLAEQKSLPEEKIRYEPTGFGFIHFPEITRLALSLQTKPKQQIKMIMHDILPSLKSESIAAYLVFTHDSTDRMRQTMAEIVKLCNQCDAKDEPHDAFVIAGQFRDVLLNFANYLRENKFVHSLGRLDTYLKDAEEKLRKLPGVAPPVNATTSFKVTGLTIAVKRNN